MSSISKPRIVFAGTPEFAAVALTALIEADLLPSLVLTQPDRPAGRGRQLRPSPVKQTALARNIPVWQPKTLKDDNAASRLAEEQPDFLIVAAYGLILPQAILDVPRIAPLNIHASLLPRWRGAAPIQAAILAGDAETGVGLMRMEAGLDTGPVYAEARTAIAVTDTGQSLHDRLAALGAALLVERLPVIASGADRPRPQDDQHATYASRIKKSDAQIDWQLTAGPILRMVRAYNPWPVAHTPFGDAMLRIHTAQAAGDLDHDLAPGHCLEDSQQRVFVGTGTQPIELLSVQIPGRRAITARDFANQCDLAETVFGEG